MFRKILFCVLFSTTFVSGNALQIKHGIFKGSFFSEKYCFEFYKLNNGSLIKSFEKNIETGNVYEKKKATTGTIRLLDVNSTKINSKKHCKEQ